MCYRSELQSEKERGDSSSFLPGPRVLQEGSRDLIKARRRVERRVATSCKLELTRWSPCSPPSSVPVFETSQYPSKGKERKGWGSAARSRTTLHALTCVTRRSVGLRTNKKAVPSEAGISPPNHEQENKMIFSNKKMATSINHNVMNDRVAFVLLQVDDRVRSPGTSRSCLTVTTMSLSISPSSPEEPVTL
ncbi:hypothetical protein ALC53_07144 [Atta colombica]|uniref:Uncharacterized protein n=1 Tax=Atta colombica TaxID=520822 RepID=A0A195BCR3_9HYME|nr:hypothetical protein ALC53_07144 [Atta colombica]